MSAQEALSCICAFALVGLVLGAVTGCVPRPVCSTDTECEAAHPDLYWQGQLESVCSALPVEVLDKYDLTECQ